MGKHVRCMGLLMASCLIGCGQARTAPRDTPERPATDALGACFDACTTGTLAGRVIWTGDVPVVPPLEIRAVDSSSAVLREQRQRDNPNAPIIDPVCHGLANAVVFLRGVDGRLARSWDLPKVRVEQRERQIHVRQGDADARVGFVRRGDSVEMTSTEPIFHSLRARGASSFALPFPDPERANIRPLNDKGVVELSSGAGYFWMRAYLFVDDHPYYARTDARGRFVLPQVPPGNYDLVCWHPSWVGARLDRDPESGIFFRLEFERPVERTLRIAVESGDELELNFELAREMFER